MLPEINLPSVELSFRLWADEPIIFAMDSPNKKRLKRPAVKEKVAMDLRLRELCSEVDLLSTTTYCQYQFA